MPVGDSDTGTSGEAARNGKPFRRPDARAAILYAIIGGALVVVFGGIAMTVLLLRIADDLGASGVVGDEEVYELLRHLTQGLQADSAINYLTLLLAVLCLAQFLVWLHRVQRNLGRLGVRDFPFSAEWAILWWFIPVANLYYPVRIVLALCRSSRNLRPDKRMDKAEAPLVIVWWIGLLIALGLGIYADRATSISADLEKLRTGFMLQLISQVLRLIVILLTMVIVYRVTVNQNESAAAARMAEAGAPAV